MDIKLYNQDCFEGLKNIPDNSVDLVLTDPPYATCKNNTVTEWDKEIDLRKLFDEYWRVLKPNGTICCCCQQPFTSKLVLNDMKNYKCSWIWLKEASTNFMNAKYVPQKLTEEIVVFSKLAGSYSTKGSMRYYPQMLEGDPYSVKASKARKSPSSVVRQNLDVLAKENNGERYPVNVIFFPRDKNKLHPTQKPVSLMEYFIKTYTTENDTVLDSFMGSGTTAVAAINQKRNFIGFEMDTKHGYFDIIKNRVNEVITDDFNLEIN